MSCKYIVFYLLSVFCLTHIHCTVARPGECDFGPWQCAAYGVLFFTMLAVMVSCLYYLGQNA